MSMFIMLEEFVMDANDIFGFVIFFWSIFIYKLFSSELRFILYDFQSLLDFLEFLDLF